MENFAELFHHGSNFHAQDYFSVHKNIDGYVFRVWAPNAQDVALVSDFTSWDVGVPFEKTLHGGIWKLSLPCDKDLSGQYYKFLILDAAGEKVYKSDPYATHSQTEYETASIIHTELDFNFTDDFWMESRAKVQLPSAPMSIYELHLGSWRRDEAGRFLDYREIAHQLTEYVLQMGYTHVELLPIAEHPFGGSWGYQICSFFAPTSRFGSPEDFAYLVNYLHEHNIGVILDWVPAHFPKDEHGLHDFDGTPLYTYSDEGRRDQRSWGTQYFDISKPEVQSFLISNALMWVEKFHIDGLRVDAVSAMLYLDYDRIDGEWTPNIHGGNENLEAMEFFRKLNSVIHEAHPEVLTIAEECTAFPGVTTSVEEGGLGFDLKWNMGWSHDMLDFASTEPRKRGEKRLALNNFFEYKNAEKYVLPLSHDEFVHGKDSLIGRMYGDYTQKFSTLMSFYVKQFTWPGKKLIFMGCDYAQFVEWNHDTQLEWFMLDFPMHKGVQDFVARLNQLYRTRPELHELDDSADGFSWISPGLTENAVLAYRRHDASGRHLAVVINFSDKAQNVTLSSECDYTTLLDTSEPSSERSYIRTDEQIIADLPLLSAVILEPIQGENI